MGTVDEAGLICLAQAVLVRVFIEPEKWARRAHEGRAARVAR